MAITLVSFPRSGRNWLCTLLDVYNGGPVFNNRLNAPNTPDLGCSKFIGIYNHDHNSNHSIGGRVLYIYRDPIDVIFSMLNSNNVWVKKDKGLKNTDERIRVWAKRWKKHTQKWYHNTPTGCTDKLVILYRDLVEVTTLELICKWIWLNGNVSPYRCEAAVRATTKEFVKKICHEENAVVKYSDFDKKKFIQEYGKIIKVLGGVS